VTETGIGISLQSTQLLDAVGSRSTAYKARAKQQEFDQILKEKLGSEGYNAKLLEACYGMESLFIENLFDAMRKTVPESGFFGQSLAKDIFRDMLYSEYAKIAAKSDQFGLARQIYERLSVQKTS
jgi:flagellar protein FlgJ